MTSLPLHLTSRISPELVDYILDYDHDSSDTLKACSTVHKSWLPTCRLHLFSSISMRPTLLKRIRSSPSAAKSIEPYLRKVSLSGARIPRGQQDFDNTVAFIGRLPHLDHLYLEYWIWDDFRGPSMEILIQQNGRFLHTLRILKMKSVRFPSFPAMVQFITRFPMLEKLDLDRVTWNDVSQPLESLHICQPPPPQLRKLYIQTCPNSPLLWWFLGITNDRPTHDHMLCKTPPLSTLVLPEVLPAEAHFVAHLLRTLGPTLEHLELGFLTDHCDEGSLPSLIREIDLGYNTNLRSLKIHQLTFYQVTHFVPPPTFLHIIPRDHPFQWLVPLLDTLDSLHLQYIMLGVWIGNQSMLELLDWQALVGVLKQPSFQELRKILVEVSGMVRGTDEVQNWLASKLEMSQGLVHIEFPDAYAAEDVNQ